MTRIFNLKLTALLLSIIMLLSLLCGCRANIGLDEIPDYRGKAYVHINGGEPFFTESEITDEAFESYSPLDPLGRCGVAFACIGIEIMPTEERGDIASVTPSGWEYGGVSNNNEYDFVENGYVYNRCHLIGFQLAGENDNEKNLITGTRYLNIEGMLPFENQVADYVEGTNNHVMYRVTPIYNGFDLVAEGVLMEAWSVEDNGRGVCFCIFAYNVQPGVNIDYFSGVNWANGEEMPEIDPDQVMGGDKDNTDDGSKDESDKDEDKDEDKGNADDGESDGIVASYVLNNKSMKYHLPGKSCADSIKQENREYYTGTKEELEAEGYVACKLCKP